MVRDNARVDKISDYIGVCNIVIFAPEDLNIVKNAPAYRRKFLNTLISKISPSYFNLLTNYSRLLAQKNALLKSIKPGDNKSDVIDQKFLTENNGKRAKSILKWVLIGLGILLAIDFISMMIYFLINGFPI